MALAMVPIDTAIITIPMIAVTAKITIAQMIPVFDAFWGTAAPALCGYAMAPRSHGSDAIAGTSEPAERPGPGLVGQATPRRRATSSRRSSGCTTATRTKPDAVRSVELAGRHQRPALGGQAANQRPGVTVGRRGPEVEATGGQGARRRPMARRISAKRSRRCEVAGPLLVDVVVWSAHAATAAACTGPGTMKPACLRTSER